MTLKELNIQLASLGNRWDVGEITDQDFDNLAIEAVLEYTHAFRDSILGPGPRHLPGSTPEED